MIEKAIHYSAGYKYQVTRRFDVQTEIKGYNILLSFVTLDENGVLSAEKGYAWNGASGPTWDTKNSMRGSCAHDMLYQLIRLGLIASTYKEYADQLLYDLCVEDGMYQFRASYWRWAVLTFGAGSCRPSAEPQELVAP